MADLAIIAFSSVSLNASKRFLDWVTQADYIKVFLFVFCFFFRVFVV